MKLKFDFWFELPNALTCLLDNKCTDIDKNKSNYYMAINKSFNSTLKAINTEVKNIIENNESLSSDNIIDQNNRDKDSSNIREKNTQIANKLKEINERVIKLNEERTKLFISSTHFSINLLKQLSSNLEEECNSFSYKSNEFKKIDKIFNNCNNSSNSNSSKGSFEEQSAKLIKKLKLSITILRYIYNESVKNLEESIKNVGNEFISMNKKDDKSDKIENSDINNNNQIKKNNCEKDSKNQKTPNNDTVKSDEFNNNHFQNITNDNKVNADNNDILNGEFYFFFLVKKVVEKLESKLFKISFKILNDNFNSLKEEITFELNENNEVSKNKQSIRFRANSNYKNSNVKESINKNVNSFKMNANSCSKNYFNSSDDMGQNNTFLPLVPK